MRTLGIDIETYSSVDLTKAGAYRYSASPDFEILLFGYSVDGGDVEVVDMAKGGKLPDGIREALTDPSVIKTAWNASFERTCIARWLGRGLDEPLDPRQWRDTMVMAAYLGLPMSLKACGAVLKLDEQKMTEGTSLITRFCKPCKPTKANGGRTRNTPYTDPEKWDVFVRYNVRDVQVEQELNRKLSKYPVPMSVWEDWFIDQEINDRGIAVDLGLVESCLAIDADAQSDLMGRMKALTGLENPGSTQQLKDWLDEHGEGMESIGKKEVSKKAASLSEGLVKDVLDLRLQAAKSSVKKYTAAMNATCPDGRARGLFQFYGATRTGRWAGRLIQLQNLPQNHIEPLADVRQNAMDLDYEGMRMLYGNVPGVLSELIRTVLVAKPGHHFAIADYSAIEARVVAWLAQEEWRLETFRTGGDIYCSSASQMFKVPVVKHGINGHLRQKGKIAELALGYGGAVGAMETMGALDMGLTKEELPDIVRRWRAANPKVVDLWWKLDDAVKKAIRCKGLSTEAANTKFRREGGFLFAELPSGRRLAYASPSLDSDGGIHYMGTTPYATKESSCEGIGGWDRLESYGPKFLENVTQAIARDLLAFSMKSLSERGVRICAHVHDEVICEIPDDGGMPLEEMCAVMGTAPAWADGLILRADGYTTPFYRKD